MDSTRELLEKTKVDFNPALMLGARERTWNALKQIAERIRVGMTEEEGLALANSTLIELGAAKRWHRSYVRFGKNTLQPYGTPSEPGVVLGPDDIFFIDIGPVWDGYEGDVGETFTTGRDPEMNRCVSDCRRLHSRVREAWQERGWNGRELYEFAAREAEAWGWRLNLVEANGHRLSDFPHAVYHRGPISDLEFSPAPGVWVLETQIRHPHRPFGAFYEDLLF